MTHRTRTPGLDALRGLATISVFVVHSVHLWWSDSGWLAMPVFFVLSGFLITGALMQAEQARLPAGARLRLFFLGRARRILPPLLLFLLLAVPLARWLGPPWDAGWFWALAFSHNLWVMSAAHQFSFFFNNLWSLSVEEQFYLIYPWIFIGLPRARRPLLILAVLAAPLLRAVLNHIAVTHPEWFTTMRAAGPGASPRDIVVYVFGGSQMDAFALGALLALGGPETFHRLGRTRWLLAATLVAIALPALLGGSLDAIRYRAFLGRAGLGQEIWGYTAVDLWACTVLAWCARHATGGTVVRLLGRLGRVSYEFYLVHFGVIALVSIHLKPRWLFSEWFWVPAEFAAALLVALLLYGLNSQVLRFWPKPAAAAKARAA